MIDCSRLMMRMILGICLMLTVVSAKAQGSLTPPAGVPAPVFKTLTQVEPRIAVQTLSGVAGDCKYLINQSGSYYLTGNVIGGSGLSGIKITTGSVTLDLNGFDVAGGTGSKTGIQCSGTNCTIRNGIIRKWGDGGVNLSFNSNAENLIVTDNPGYGINASIYVGIRNCTITQNGSVGVFMHGSSILENCNISNNDLGGISVSDAGGRISHCTITYNTGRGIAQSSGSGWIFSDNAIYNNTMDGISAQGGNLITNNVISSNGFNHGNNSLGAGIYAGGGRNHIEGNHLVGNTYGIYLGNNPGKEIVIRNTVESSTTNNYNGNGGNNTTTVAPIITTLAGSPSPLANISIP